MIILIVQRVRMALLGMVAMLLLGVGTAHAQVVNHSFEEDGQFSLAGWQVTDESCTEAYDKTPDGGGTWSLKLHRRNLQGGCFGVAYQVIPTVQEGGVWRVSAWVRVPEGSGPARVYWTKFEPSDNSGVLPYLPAPYGAVTTSTADQWLVISRIDTLSVDSGDSLGIVLDAGVTSGPTLSNDFVYFDLISVDQPGGQDIAADTEETPETPALGGAYNFPNPFQSATTISFTLNRSDFVTLDVYDLLGRKVSRLIAEHLPGGTHTAQWQADDLPDGLYVGRLQAGAQVRTVKLVRLR